MPKNILKYVSMVLCVIYTISVCIIAVHFDVYEAIYPEYKPLYLFKLCVSAILLGFLSTPAFKLDTEQTNTFYIVLWISMLSILPDLARCINILL